MKKTVKYEGDSFDDKLEFLTLEKSKEVVICCNEFESELRKMWKYEEGKTADDVWELWHDAMFHVKDVLNGE